MPGLMILRHAQSTWNAEGRWQGQADPPLSALGESQARLAARRVASEERFDLIVSSDLSRALRTAVLMASELRLDAPHEVEFGLREYDVGLWSGYSRQEIEATWPGELARFARGELEAPPGGETRTAFDSRVGRAGRRVAKRALADGARRVLVVAHGGVVRSLARSAGGPDVPAGHLAGYRGRVEEDGLLPIEPVDLLVGEDDSSHLSL